MNAPEKLSVHLCCICAMLIILSEIRVMADAQRNGFYLFSSALAALFLISNALPTVIASYAGILNGGEVTLPPVHCYVFISLGILSIVRLIMTDVNEE